MMHGQQNIKSSIVVSYSSCSTHINKFFKYSTFYFIFYLDCFQGTWPVPDYTHRLNVSTEIFQPRNHATRALLLYTCNPSTVQYLFNLLQPGGNTLKRQNFIQITVTKKLDSALNTGMIFL
jgi:hypothetical protein